MSCACNLHPLVNEEQNKRLLQKCLGIQIGFLRIQNMKLSAFSCIPFVSYFYPLFIFWMESAHLYSYFTLSWNTKGKTTTPSPLPQAQ